MPQTPTRTRNNFLPEDLPEEVFSTRRITPGSSGGGRYASSALTFSHI